MKIRSGFISNSSSSSFILGVKPEATEEDIRKIIEEKMGIKDNSILAFMKDDLIDALVSDLIPLDLDVAIAEADKYDDDSYAVFCKDLQTKGLKFFRGSVEDDCGAAQKLFCDTAFHMEDKDFYIDKPNAGY